MKTKLNKKIVTNILIGIFFVATYIYALLVPVTSDAGKYAAISRVIFESGDWINLKVHFEPYLQKPPLLFWITTPFFYLLGTSAFAFKLPVLLYSGIAVYSTYRFTKLFYSNETAKIAALFLASSEFYFLFHNDIHTDCLLTANVIFAVWQVAEYSKSGKLKNILLAGVGVGLALISKGPIGIFVPLMATITHLVVKNQFQKIFSFKILSGAIVALIILCFGLLGTYKQFGWEGIRFFFWDNNAGRISGSLKGSSNDYFFYLHTALYIFMPWGVIFFISLFSEINELFRKKSTELFSLGGILFFWIIISYSRAKAPHYFMVLSPFMAIISAKWIIRYFNKDFSVTIKKSIIFIQYATIVLIWLILFAFCIYFFPNNNLLFWIAIGVLIVLFFTTNTKTQLIKILNRSVISIIAINFALNVHLFPTIFTYQSVIPACEVFNSKAADNEMLNTYLSEHRELFFYAKNPGHFLYNSADLKKCLANENNWIYTNDEGLKEIQNSKVQIEIAKSFKHRSMSKLTGNFINPVTRDKSLKNMHLINIIVPDK